MNNIGGKYEAFGWEVAIIDGNSIEELEQALSRRPSKPYFIWCKTVKGSGFTLMENDPEGWHHRVITEAEFEELNKELL